MSTMLLSHGPPVRGPPLLRATLKAETRLWDPLLSFSNLTFQHQSLNHPQARFCPEQLASKSALLTLFLGSHVAKFLFS